MQNPPRTWKCRGHPTLLWHRTQDLSVPLAHEEWLARHIPSAEVHQSPVDGRVTLFERRVPEVHAWIRTHF